MKRITYLAVMVSLFACSDKEAFDLQGHRGARGIMPENTIPAFIYALEQGVNTLELDLAVSRDDEIIVSHEPYISAEICLDTLGSEFEDSIQHMYNIYQMTYDQIRQFDCGLKAHPHFPEQKKVPVPKPLLTDVIDTIESYIEMNNLKEVSYNLEIKSSPAGDHKFHPSPGHFSELVYKLIDGRIDWTRVNVQSFDFRILQHFHQKYPEVDLAVLIGNKLPPQKNLDSLGFIPEIYSPHYTLLSHESVQSLQEQGMKVIPWTVNEKEDMKRVINWGVDGLITDYPNRYNELTDE